MAESITWEQRLLLRAALAHDRRSAAQAWASWREAVDFDAVDQASQRLLPLAARRPQLLDSDDPVAGRLRGLYRHTWASNRLLWRHAAPVASGFARAGLPFLLLKGMALLDAYGDWGARPMYDVDVLIRPEDFTQALAALEAAGWEPELGTTFDWVRTRARFHSHAWGFRSSEGGRLDLHWHVLWSSVGERADDAFWRSSVPYRVGDVDAGRLQHADLVFHLLVHGTIGPNAPPIQWIADVLTVLRRAACNGRGEQTAARIGWLCNRHGLLDPVRESLGALEVVMPGEEEVVRLRASLARQRRGVLDVIRASGGPGASPVRRAPWMLARFVAGETGAVTGVGEFLRDRLHRGVVRAPLAAGVYAASGRSNLVGGLLRRRVGSFVAIGTPSPGPLDPPATLDFTAEVVLDRYGGPGWGIATPDGSSTRGAEARLQLPLAGGARSLQLVVELTTTRPGPLDLRANEVLVSRTDLVEGENRVSVVVPADVVSRFVPFELSLRRPHPRPWRASGLAASLRSISLER